MTKRDLTDSEKRAWELVTRHVKPLTGRKANPTRIRSKEVSEPALLPLSSSRKLQKLSEPQNRQNERGVRRGKQVVSASFDLHGHTQDSAWRLLPAFLAREQARGSRCVIVITGKGRSGEGVLRKNFLHWLELPEARGFVSGYAPAHARHGGGGAWYVYLRKPR